MAEIILKTFQTQKNLAFRNLEITYNPPLQSAQQSRSTGRGKKDLWWQERRGAAEARGVGGAACAEPYTAGISQIRGLVFAAKRASGADQVSLLRFPCFYPRFPLGRRQVSAGAAGPAAARIAGCKHRTAAAPAADLGPVET